jgi:tRNA nucleotidyltransferase (CCA-adding enzyme)
MGGGGHPSAAAATIKGPDPDPGGAGLFRKLHRQIIGMRQAKHLMSSRPSRPMPQSAVREANTLLTRYNINALLVTSGRARKTVLLGYITSQVIEKIIYHDLGHVPVSDYMNTEMVTVPPDAECWRSRKRSSAISSGYCP